MSPSAFKRSPEFGPVIEEEQGLPVDEYREEGLPDEENITEEGLPDQDVSREEEGLPQDIIELLGTQ